MRQFVTSNWSTFDHGISERESSIRFCQNSSRPSSCQIRQASQQLPNERGRHNCICESLTFIVSTSASQMAPWSAKSSFCSYLPLSSSKTSNVLRQVISCDEVILPRYSTVR